MRDQGTRQAFRSETDPEVRDLLGRYHVAHTALHVLWTRAVGTHDYNKADWKVLETEIDRVFGDEAKRIGYQGALLP